MNWIRWCVLSLLLTPATLTADDYRLLHFEATWCGPCKTLKANIRHRDVVAAMKVHGIRCMDIDVDEDPRGTERYKVTDIPDCILVRVNAKNEATVIRRRVGVMQPRELIEFVKLPVAAKKG